MKILKNKNKVLIKGTEEIEIKVLIEDIEKVKTKD
ncbi:hypothetical protein CDIF102859_00819 [Clostridioides difficile]|nr:hypothetical protein CDIF102859_00819 [Clostridioides difficile]AXU30524.1 hypothetical protein CDIF102860_00910 [Clostridioides difficile]AXU34312.1 hypothetical protein CDIF102978_00910 [Clostridioides difficile]SJV19399.1 Uncharacterised protein [Clostridioides difficile]SJV30420.1 Uncharacterised protein [Clostridioides difficile]